MNNGRRRSAWLTALILVAACLVPEHGDAAVRAPAPHVRATPGGECSPSFAGALEIQEDGTWFECVCEQLRYVEPVCDWYEITSPADDPQRLRRIPAKARLSHRLSRPIVIVPRGVRL